MVNAAIFILTQNTPVRRTYLKTCLYFLFKHFNEKYRYPVLIFHEGDYDDKAQREITMSVRASVRSLISFVAMDAKDFEVPDFIDKEKMEQCIATRPVPYWRSAKYRMMCRWWMVNVHKYAAGYDYFMRLDDDSLIEEPITKDLFAWTEEKGYNYVSNLIHMDCGVCCYGMKEFFEKAMPPGHDEEIRKMFVKQEIPLASVQFQAFRTLLSVTQPPGFEMKDNMTLWMPIMYYNNFFITRTAFWKQPEVMELVDKIDKDGSIFYYRWGDAPLQTIVAMLKSPAEKISRAVFKYSKRLQREAFEDDIGEYHSYMPETYDKSSCITESNIKQ